MSDPAMGGDRCPFCDHPGEGCEHYLGSRDRSFGGDFGLDEGGPLFELAGLFEQLEAAAVAFARPRGRITTSRPVAPARLRALIRALAPASPGRFDPAALERRRAFDEYLSGALRDTRVPVRRTSVADDAAPGLSSQVDSYWARDARAAVAGVRARVGRDIRRLRGWLGAGRA